MGLDAPYDHNMRCSGNVMASRDLVPTCGSGCDSSKTNHEDLKSPPRAKRLIHCAGVALRSRQYGPDGGSVSEVRPIGPSELVRPFWGPIFTGRPSLRLSSNAIVFSGVRFSKNMSLI
mmetsp:Transcript_4838/g.10085  ORF Transcript_4838/g.10085 Transcript_4838/m.10085 type:complete len:118 (+) Transcript_4838:87-440(+)